ncbi:unnamed protein product [Rotaria socialis]|uniref:MYND-type domain-containing protein n=1 Tax=Rotaria socialis TaxID=392032 RepID=A0A818ACM6_9BILA|nr:unnamed protein product [Rotaria socialis]CAF3371203.1 unnamed protein product [Rotaria socialis]CAF3399125.1 unnamed protein product [Rotaria socialis]CAF3545363.1 unnamed protein product [Rotaria socialis]CAF3722190.1 unnamed protein product [Rotaria socialis]
MAIFTEAPYIAALKEEFLTNRCSSCFKSSRNKCSDCRIIVYCNDQCRINDQIYHKLECEYYKNKSEKLKFEETVIARMILRVITRLNLDGGQPSIDLCSNLPDRIHRRSWFDLVGHRDEIPYSDRHWNLWLTTINQVKLLVQDQFDNIDLLAIFGKILINRFRVAFHENPFNERICIGWAIYLTVSGFNHSCQPDLLQCSYDINMRLKFNDSNRTIPETTVEFNKLTVNYRHQNDFRLKNPSTYVPTRKQRRNFINFFFFNCHCIYCSNDLRNRYAESSTNRLCSQCGDFLVLEKNFNDSMNSILVCLGRNKCSQYDKIIDRINISSIDNAEETIKICEDKLSNIEQLLHPQSILLLQQREKVFFAYQKLLNENNLNENQRTNYINRAIQLGELLMKQYDIHLQQSSIYPKIFLTDLANLCDSVGKEDQAKQLYSKALHLWRQDYQDHIDYKDFYVKL